MDIIIKKITCLFLVLLFAGCDKAVNKLVPLPDPIAAKKAKLTVPHTTFSQPKVDILFVIDDSGSMSDHQKNLAKNTELFINAIKKVSLVDFNVAVTTSDDFTNLWGSPVSGNRKAGEFVNLGGKKVVNGKTPNMEKILAANFIVGTSGSGTEKFLSIVEQALSKPLIDIENSGFLRPQSSLALIFVTDADDQSNTSPQQLYDFLMAKVKPNSPAKVLTYGALIHPTQTDCINTENATTTKIFDFIAMFNGITFKICDPDFGTKFTSFAEDIVSKTKRFIPLSDPPIPSTIEVSYDGELLPADPIYGWSFSPSQNAIILGPKFELKFKSTNPNASIEVRFNKAVY